MRLYCCVIKIYDIPFLVTIVNNFVQSLTLATPEKYLLLLRSATASTKARMMLLGPTTTKDVFLDG